MANVTSVASSASNTTLLSANVNAGGRAIFNDSTSVVYVLFGSGATSGNYTVQIAAGGYFEFPMGNTGIHRGQVDAIWASANGFARVTEW